MPGRFKVAMSSGMFPQGLKALPHRRCPGQTHTSAENARDDWMMSQTALAGSDPVSSAASSAPRSQVREPPGVPVGELDLIVAALVAKFPGYTFAHVRDVVYATHRRLDAAARIRAHLIPLIVDLSRAQLEREMAASSPVSN